MTTQVFPPDVGPTSSALAGGAGRIRVVRDDVLDRDLDALHLALRAVGHSIPHWTVANLGSGCLSPQTVGSLEFFVVEGAHHYRLGEKARGYGIATAGAERAHLNIVGLPGEGRQPCLLGDAEIRLNPARPWRSRRLLARAAIALIQQGALLRAGTAVMPRVPTSRPSLGLLSILRWMKRWFIPSIRQSLENRFRRRKRQWSIGLLGSSAVDVRSDFPWGEVRWLEPPKNGIIADPFLAQDDDSLWLFYERMLFGEARGTLWVARLNSVTAEMHDAAEILRAPYHLSFPNVFKHDGQWYLLPEQARSGSTMLYRASEFPNRWEPCRVLLPDFPGIDPVLHHQDGRWWLFVTHGMEPCNENNLHLFSAGKLEDEFLPHPMNPICSGLHGSRMAGPIFRRGDKLIRPAQDGRRGYGKGTVLFEVISLDAQNYAERQLITWSPQSHGPFGEAFHTYSPCGGLAAVDGQRYCSGASCSD